MKFIEAKIHDAICAHLERKNVQFLHEFSCPTGRIDFALLNPCLNGYGEIREYASDPLLIPHIGAILEVKVFVDTHKLDAAIGQLLDYGRSIPHARLALVLPEIHIWPGISPTCKRVGIQVLPLNEWFTTDRFARFG